MHMVDARSKAWRTERSLSKQEAERRVDAAVSAIATADFIYPIGITVSGADVCDALGQFKVKITNKAASNFEPDYLCFLAYVVKALNFVSREHQECERLDFIVERNGKITEYIQAFHADVKGLLEGRGDFKLARLLGELLPVGKDCIPVQAADVLCWHTARGRNPATMEGDDYRRYMALSKRRGDLRTFSREEVMEFAKTFPPEPRRIAVGLTK